MNRPTRVERLLRSRERLKSDRRRILTAGIDLLNEHVRTLFVGTHSRQIEGELLTHKEGSTRFVMNALPDPVALTVVDGGQIWQNGKLPGR